ncbi:MAG TPA: YbaY family lipoprotein [Nitrospiraceae bacterium]
MHIIGPGNPPIAFAIDTDPQRVDERQRYSMRATITVDGNLLFTTDQSYPVLTQGNGRNVELLLRQTGRALRHIFTSEHILEAHGPQR